MNCYLSLFSIMKKAREKLINDILNEDPQTYMVLYSDMDSEIIKLYTELYDLEWIENIWNSIYKYICENQVSPKEKGEIIAVFAKWYCKYYDDNKKNYSFIDIHMMKSLIDLKIQNLESIIDFEERCKKNIYRIKTTFTKNIKLLKNQIKKMEEL